MFIFKVTFFWTLLTNVVYCINLQLLSNSKNKTGQSPEIYQRTEELKLCNKTVNEFQEYWYDGNFYLYEYLAILKSLQCPQFQTECQQQTYAFTEFTNLMYLRFCDQIKLEDKCLETLKKLVRKYSSENVTATTWNDVVDVVDSISRFKNEDLKNSCLQIAMFKTKNDSQFVEIIDVVVPFCSIVWCGFDEMVFHQDVSLWTCLKPRCQTGILVIVVFGYLLAVSIVLCNVMVIAVFMKNPKLLNTQSVYRISLAIADLLIGTIVAPTYAHHINHYFNANLKNDGYKNTSRYFVGKDNTSFRSFQLTYVLEPIIQHVSFPQSYINFVGFFTSTALIAAILSLAGAAVDRFFVVYRPIAYKTSFTTKRAKKVTAGIWIFAVISSLLPVWIEKVRYGFTYPTLILSDRPISFALYLIGKCLPLVILWVVTIATYISYKIQTKKRMRMNASVRNKQEFSQQMRLMSTLGIIVVVFSVCFLPAIVLVAEHFFEKTSTLHEMYYITRVSTINTFVSLEYSAIFLLLTNSLWNFFIYSYRTEVFRLEMKKMIKSIRGKCFMK